jgi:hypothetical protein
MPTLTQAILFVIFLGASIALVLLWGKFCKVGAGQEAPPPDEAANKLADHIDALITARKAAELAWMDALQDQIAEHRAELAELAHFPNTHAIIKLRTIVRVKIDGDERTLELLRKRDGKVTAANLWEGRM